MGDSKFDRNYPLPFLPLQQSTTAVIRIHNQQMDSRLRVVGFCSCNPPRTGLREDYCPNAFMLD